MTAFTARRRAEEFDSLVEGTSTGRDDARYAEFLDIVAQLALGAGARGPPRVRQRPPRAADGSPPRPSWRPPTTTPGSPSRPAGPPASAGSPIAVGALALVGATTSVAMAAQSALPGEALYPVKRAIENAQTGFSTDEADKGSRLLANATGRLDEVTELSAQGDLARQRRDRLDAQHVHRAGHRRLRPAAGRLRRHRQRDLDRRAAHLHRRQHGHADRARGDRARSRPATS